jgi:hypothetical protein
VKLVVYPSNSAIWSFQGMPDYLIAGRVCFLLSPGREP